MKTQVLKKILLLLFVPCISFSITLSDIRTQIRRDMVDVKTSTTIQRFSDTEINFLINNAQREICDVVWCLYTSTNISVLSGTTYYTLPTNYYAIERVVYDNQYLLPEKTIALMDREDSSWISANPTNPPENYYLSIDKTQIGLYPCINESSKILKVDYIKVPTDLSSDSDVPYDSNPKFYPYHELIILRVLGWIYNQDQKLNQASIMFSLYTSGLNRMANQIKVSPNFVPSFGVQRQ